MTDANQVLTFLPQAVVRVDARLRALWIEKEFSRKTGLSLERGGSLGDVLEAGPTLEYLARSVRTGASFSGEVVTRSAKQVRLRSSPARTGQAWLVFEPAGLDDAFTFAQALQEIARAISESLDLEAVCAAAAVAAVRCAQIVRAEVHLTGEGGELRRVAASDLAGPTRPPAFEALSAALLRQALISGRPEIGSARGSAAWSGMTFAAVPLSAQGRTLGLLALYKEKNGTFSDREIDLWSAAAGQLTVGLENARLFREAQAALHVRDEFMSIASHELKTPLTPLKMCLAMMERRLMLGEPIDLSMVVRSQRQVDRLTGLVSDLLDASRLELGQLTIARQPIDLSQLVVEVVDGFRCAFRREFVIVGPGERLWVQGDRDRLEQVLVNLLENAQKYSPEREPVRIELEATEGQVAVHVVDRGIGIPDADQAQIFHRFYRARNVSNRHFAGLGLGLFISQSIIKLHRGEMSLQSDEGRGSKFTVRLPRMPAPEVHVLPRRVLVVEEVPEEEEQIRRHLRSEPFEVLAARDGADALRKLAHGPIDVVVVSCSLPHGRLFTQAACSLPRVHPLPFIFRGEVLPDWAPPDAHLCQRRALDELRELLSQAAAERPMRIELSTRWSAPTERSGLG